MMKLPTLKLPAEPIQKHIKYGEFIEGVGNVLRNFMETTDLLENYPTINKPEADYINHAVYNILTAYLHNDHF